MNSNYEIFRTLWLDVLEKRLAALEIAAEVISVCTVPVSLDGLRHEFIVLIKHPRMDWDQYFPAPVNNTTAINEKKYNG